MAVRSRAGTSRSVSFTTSGIGGKTTNIGEWWQDLVTTNEIAKIRASQEAKFLAIEKADALNREILRLQQNLFKSVRSRRGTTATASVPAEFDRLIGLFEEGGQFGEGAKAEIERGSQEALGAGQIGLASTGMSSGTNVAGLQARIFADAALSKAQIEDQRVAALGGALEAKGAAGVAVQSENVRARTQSQAEFLRALTALKPNFVAA